MTINEKAPGAVNAEGLTHQTINDWNFATDARPGKALTTLIAEFALQGYAAQSLGAGAFLVTDQYGKSIACNDVDALYAAAREVGVAA